MDLCKQLLKRMFVICWLILLVNTCKAQGTDNSTILPWYVWFILAIGLAIAIILIGLVGFYVLNVCKKIFGNRHIVYSENTNSVIDRKQENAVEENDGVNTLILSNTSPIYQQLEIPRENIKVLSQLGIGEYGPLYDAEVQLKVNIKSRALIKVFQQGTSQDLVLFKQELDSLISLAHSRVAQLFGLVSSSPFYAVLELPLNGDLKTFLLTTKTSKTDLTLGQLVAMSTDAASGLAYLESIQYIHQDIAARNCTVTQTLGVKIADYKVGRYLFRSEYAVQADGSLMPVRWMAPESLLENHFSLQADIWSFGVLLWEILTKGQFPFAELSDGEVVQDVCYDFQRLLQPVSCPDNIYQVMLKCWHSNPAQRPRMEHLHQQLETSILHVSNNEQPINVPPPPTVETEALINDTDTGIAANDFLF